jgi:hypothetical protein
MMLYKFIHNFFLIYIWSVAVIDKIITQSKKTSRLLVNSFSDETLYFFPESIIPLIVTNNSLTIINPDLESGCWSFNKSIFRFMEEDSTVTKKIPYLSASLYKDDVFLADLSEWIQNIEVISSRELPVRFLVFGWAYQNRIVLESYTTSKYFLEVITIDGDESRIDIKTA